MGGWITKTQEKATKFGQRVNVKNSKSDLHSGWREQEPTSDSRAPPARCMHVICVLFLLQDSTIYVWTVNGQQKT